MPFFVFPLLLLIFPLSSLVFVSLVAVYLGVFLLGFIPPGASVLPGLGRLFPFPGEERFRLLSVQVLSQAPSLSPPAGTPVM